MPKLTLWKMDSSPPASAVRALADILGVELDLIDVDFVNQEHKSPEYLKMNPLGTLPVLRDGDFTLTDSHAQMKYLVSKYGGDVNKKLYPSDIRAQAVIDQSLFCDAGVLFIRIEEVAIPTMFDGLTGPTDRHIKRIESGYSVVEAYIGNNKYVAGDHLTIADLSLGSTIAMTRAIHNLDKNKFPKASAWLERLFEIPQFHKYVSVGEKLFKEELKGGWAKNNSQ